jgi:hypothetical protein
MAMRNFYFYVLLLLATTARAVASGYEQFVLDLLEIKELVGLTVVTPVLDGLVSGALCHDSESVMAALQDAVACLAAAKNQLSNEQVIAYSEKLEAYWAAVTKNRAPRPPFIDPAEAQLASGELTYFPRDVVIARNLEVGGNLFAGGELDIDTSTISFIDTTNASTFQCLNFEKSRNGAIVQNGDAIGCITFQGFDGGQFIPGALLQAQIDSVPGEGDMPGRFVFLTTPSGTAIPTEKMRISNAGLVTLSNNLDLPATTNASTGVITKAGVPFSHTFGTNNTFYGVGAGNFTLVGIENTGIGFNALAPLTGGNQNVAVGGQALISLTNGSNNTAIGFQAADLLTVGFDNVALGRNAIGGSTGASRNVAIGRSTLVNAGTPTDNVMIGHFAGQPLGGTSTQNVFIGENAGTSAAGGLFAPILSTNGSTLVGSQAGSGTPSGLSNMTALGAQAFCNADDATALGILANASHTASTALGAGAITTLPNQIQLGAVPALVSLRCQVALTVVSDERHKRDIQECELGLAFIKNIRPISYDKDGVKEFGFSAQEVAHVAEDLGVEFPGVSYSAEEDLYWMRHTDLFAPIVKAIQELSAKIALIKAEIAELECAE